MKIMTVVGARPNFMKAAPIIAAIQAHNREQAPPSVIQHLLLHTGQHYDQQMSGSFFSDLDLGAPDIHLGVGSGSHAGQTSDIMTKFERVLLEERPDILIVVGDVNSTVACALVAAKIAFNSAGARPLIAHVEAGLRSHDRSMPEEINRVVTDHLSDILFVTEESGLRNLDAEGVPASRIHFVGNTMIDSLLAFQGKADRSTILSELRLRDRAVTNAENGGVAPYALLTLHRPSNVDDRSNLQNILDGLEELAADRRIVFPIHPRTRKRIAEYGLDSRFAPGVASDHGIIAIDPLGYIDFVCLMKNAGIVVTDSGGIQEETTCLGVPCVTVRENTERPVTLENGANVIAGTASEGIKTAIRRQLTRKPAKSMPPKWDGRAAFRIVNILANSHGDRSLSLVSAGSAAQ